ncbi:regulator RcnB of Ni and Co efflux [Roseovarius lutimaris]|uniref:Regulator RcnB of Ni and Co efflux n=1 Tax=Roseovarius lutimaris TaxID=1005928 RepID=A0A1I5H1M8_9RHOB|nr:RcnB family protein [Roseovarius lutimaris]SFO42218.1 regulator RcnB of Ni and Co efflux [Roseovarius lutimaris]
MQNRMKRCVTIFVLATVTAVAVPITAMADRAIVKYSAHGHSAKAKAVKQQRHRHRHRHAVGHRFRKQDVVVVNNWRARGLPRPSRNEVYIANGDSIYLAAAATLLVKALIN